MQKSSTQTKFKVGELVRFVHVKKSKHPQIWKRTEGLGVIVSTNKIEESDLDTCVYTVLSNGEAFDCIEVYPIESSEYVRANNEDKHRKE